jgi:hypothetical protein
MIKVSKWPPELSSFFLPLIFFSLLCILVDATATRPNVFDAEQVEKAGFGSELVKYRAGYLDRYSLFLC